MRHFWGHHCYCHSVICRCISEYLRHHVSCCRASAATVQRLTISVVLYARRDNYNVKSHKRRNNIVSYEFIWTRRTCDYIRLNVRYCVLFSSKIRVRIRFNVWLVSCCAHAFVLRWVVIVTLPRRPTNWPQRGCKRETTVEITGRQHLHVIPCRSFNGVAERTNDFDCN